MLCLQSPVAARCSYSQSCRMPCECEVLAVSQVLVLARQLGRRAAGVAYVLHSKSVRFGSDPGLCILVSLSMMLCAQKIIRVTSSRWSSESNTHEVELFSQWTHIVNRFVTLLVFSKKKTTCRQDIFCSKNPCAHFELIRTCFLYHTPKISMLFPSQRLHIF